VALLSLFGDGACACACTAEVEVTNSVFKVVYLPDGHSNEKSHQVDDAFLWIPESAAKVSRQKRALKATSCPSSKCILIESNDSIPIP
jgi:hypothetical protein